MGKAADLLMTQVCPTRILVYGNQYVAFLVPEARPKVTVVGNADNSGQQHLRWPARRLPFNRPDLNRQLVPWPIGSPDANDFVFVLGFRVPREHLKDDVPYHQRVNVPANEQVSCLRFDQREVRTVGVQAAPGESSDEYQRSIRNCPLLLESVAFRFTEEAWMNVSCIVAHGAPHSPLGEVLLILSVKRDGNVFNHRAHEFLDGHFHPAHPSVVAPLADARKAHFLVLGDFRWRVTQLAVKWLASVDAPQNPTWKQIFFRVNWVATEDTKLHDAKCTMCEP